MQWVQVSLILSIVLQKIVASEDVAGDFLFTSSGTKMEKVHVEDWQKQCVETNVEYETGNYITWYSEFNFLDKPSGLCSYTLACAFQKCVTKVETILDKHPNKQGTMSLPDFMTFPSSVKDIVEVVQYAKANCRTISIKTGGNSFPGSFNEANSIQLNMRHFPHYSNTSIFECHEPNTKISACKLALARNKNAVMRVGGGELWDEPYRAVMDYLSSSGSAPKYDVVGGGYSAASAIGGWMQGGGLSVGDERMYGFGADQVLELEMVLADGTHVKFSPSEWTSEPSFLYPKTTKVTGFCNSNVSSDEDEWKWVPCDDNKIPFQSLWKAVRGGGGGTYGVVTAATYQLHDHLPLYAMSIPTSNLSALIEACSVVKGMCKQIKKRISFFFLDYLYHPESLDVDEKASNSCGHPGFNFYDLRAYFPLYCRDPDSFVKAWKKQVSKFGYSHDDTVHSKLLNLFEPQLAGTYAKTLISFGRTSDIAPAGMLNDFPNPAWFDYAKPCWSALIPLDFLKHDRSDFMYELLKAITPVSHTLGGKATSAHDQITAINPIQRYSGLEACIPDINIERKAREHFQKYYSAYNPNQRIAGGTEFNHISNIKFGPLKNNPQEPCPDHLSYEEQKASCVSIEEDVWGTDLLAELESIKKEVDPNNMFKCYRCIGYENEGCTLKNHAVTKDAMSLRGSVVDRK